MWYLRLRPKPKTKSLGMCAHLYQQSSMYIHYVLISNQANAASNKIESNNFPCEDGDNDDIYFVRKLKFHFGECAVKVGTIQIQTRLRASLHTNSPLGQPQEFYEQKWKRVDIFKYNDKYK